MKRLHYIVITLVLATNIVIACEPTRGKVAALAPIDSPWDDHWRYFKNKISERDCIELDYYIRGETGTEEAMLTATRRNRVQITGVTMWALAGIIPEASIPMIPFLFHSEEEVDFVHDNFLKPVFTKLLDEKGLVFLGWVDTGWNNIYSNHDISYPDDLEGLKLRGSPNFSAKAFINAIGADYIPLGTSDIGPALQTGLVDGGLSGMVYFYYALSDFATNVLQTNQSYDQGVTVANKAWWQTLSQEQKEGIMSSFYPTQEVRKDVRKLIHQLIDNLKEKNIKVRTMTPQQREVWVKSTKPTHKLIVNQVGGGAAKLYDIVLEGKKAFKTASTKK